MKTRIPAWTHFSNRWDTNPTLNKHPSQSVNTCHEFYALPQVIEVFIHLFGKSCFPGLERIVTSVSNCDHRVRQINRLQSEMDDLPNPHHCCKGKSNNDPEPFLGCYFHQFVKFLGSGKLGTSIRNPDWLATGQGFFSTRFHFRATPNAAFKDRKSILTFVGETSSSRFILNSSMSCWLVWLWHRSPMRRMKSLNAPS